MKISKYTILIILTILTRVPALALEPAINFHVECGTPSDSCIEFPFAENSKKTLFLKRAPSIKIKKESIEKIVASEVLGGGKIYTIILNEDTASLFYKFSKENLRKLVAIVGSNGYIFMAPYLEAPIPNGRIQLTMGSDSQKQTSDSSFENWVDQNFSNKMDKQEAPKVYRIDRIWYVVIAILFVLITIFYTFLRFKFKT